jgi:hypothetical protein
MVDGSNGLKDLQPPPAGHLLVEQDDPVRLALEEDQGVVSMSCRFDGETLLFEKQDVRREALDLIIHP